MKSIKPRVLLVWLLVIIGTYSCFDQNNNKDASHPRSEPETFRLIAPAVQPDSFEIPIPPDSDRLTFTQRIEGFNSIPTSTPNFDLVGQKHAFWVIDLANPEVRRIKAELRVISPNAIWFVEDGLNVSKGSLEITVSQFEEYLLPKITEMFGSPISSRDGKLAILHTKLHGAAGYVHASDQLPSTIHPFSNQLSVIYLSDLHQQPGNPGYMATLTHELQHLVHLKADPSEEAWINEGLSELATDIAGYPSPLKHSRRFSASTPLTLWGHFNDSASQYLSSSLFFNYLYHHYVRPMGLQQLLNVEADGILGINHYLHQQGYPEEFSGIFGDWIVASFLGHRGIGKYTYPEAPLSLFIENQINQSEIFSGSNFPFSSTFVRIVPTDEHSVIEFQGEEFVPILPISLQRGNACWWSNNGDSIHSKLTRSIDLSHVKEATLQFKIWHNIETFWDYGFVAVSKNNGDSWDLLNGLTTTTDNPVGNSPGPGFTGPSNGWVQERMDLSAYSGENILLSFQYLTDGAINLHGYCLSDISIPEIGLFDDQGKESDWSTYGFTRSNNLAPQAYLVQLIELFHTGDFTVKKISLDQSNYGSTILSVPLNQLESAVVIVSSIAQGTSQSGKYELRLH